MSAGISVLSPVPEGLVGPEQQGLWSTAAAESKLSLSETSWTIGYDFSWDR